MSLEKRLTVDERAQIEALIQAFDNHGCGLGLDIQAQVALRRLLGALDEAEQAVEQFRELIIEQRGDSA
jgi:hypothetical protein